jgi:hypothetical protein
LRQVGAVLDLVPVQRGRVVTAHLRRVSSPRTPLPADLTNGIRVAVVAPAATRRLFERFTEHLPDGRTRVDRRLGELTAPRTRGAG